MLNVHICLHENTRVNLKSHFINARRRPFHKWAFHLQCRVINCYLMDGAHALTALSTVRARSLSTRLSREARCDIYERAITARFHRWALDRTCGNEKSQSRSLQLLICFSSIADLFLLDSISESPDSLIFLLRKSNLVGFSFRVFLVLYIWSWSSYGIQLV